jgi:hypothetical protein
MRREDLIAAAAEGIVTRDQAERLAAFLAAREAGPEPAAPAPQPGEERFRLIGGFNDVFVAIGIGLVYAALMTLAGLGSLGSPTVALLISAGIAWALAEVFTARMRLALPSIVLCILFTASMAGAMAAFLAGTIDIWSSFDLVSGRLLFLPGLILAGAAAIHFLRFRVPISVAMIAAGLVAAAVGLAARFDPMFVANNLNLVALLCGVAVFALAMRFDTSDPERRTWRSDAAFWLHLLAAPLIVHPAVFGLAGGPTLLGGGSPAVILALFAAFTLVAIVVDRRALIVSALAYAGGSIAYYLGEGGFGGGAFTLLLLGGVILALSAGWKPLRRTILPLLPIGALKARLPPP